VLSFQVLGPLRVLDEHGGDLTPPGELQRRLLEALLVEHGAVVPADRLADLLWGEQLPANQATALQTHVSRLRKHLPGCPISHERGGYRLGVDAERIDAESFERLVLAAAAVRAEDPARAVALVEEALRAWRGEPFPLLADGDAARAARARLLELCHRARDERIEALLALGGAAEVLADLEAAVIEHPSRERPHEQLMRALVDTGRSVDALRVYDRFRRFLAEEVGVEPSAQLRTWHDAIVTGRAAAHPADDPHAAPGGAHARPDDDATPSNLSLAAPPLPRPVSSFVGRADELATLSGLVGRHRLVTVVGTGGVGKTRLALEAAHRLAGTVPDGVVFIELAGSSRANALDAIAARLGVEPRAGQTIEQRLVTVLRHRAVLVVVDNCEHVVDVVAPLVEQWVTLSDAVRVLATSRERLGVDGERLLPLSPLALTGAGDDDGAGGAGPAVELFVDRAQAMRPELDPHDDATAALVASLCRRLGGLPLAIELAAAQLHTLELTEILEEISGGLSVLATPRRHAPRHRSLSATIGWSFDRLDPGERTALVQLATFRRAFDLVGAAAVLDRPARDTRAVLQVLGERSLLQRSGREHVMLEPIREFARERAEAVGGGEHRAARDRHARYHVELAESLNDSLRGDQPGEAMQRFDGSLVDLRAAYEQLLATGGQTRLCRLAVACADFGLLRPRHEVLEWGAVAARDGTVGDPHAADAASMGAVSAWARGDQARFAERVQDAWRLVGPHGSPPVRLLAVQGLAALTAGQLEAARRWYDQALAVPGTDRLRWCELAATRVLSLAYSGHPRAEHEAEALLVQPEVDGPTLAAMWLWYAAGEALVAIDPARAEAPLQRCIELARRGGAGFVIGIAGASLASLAVRRGDLGTAIDDYRQLIPRWASSGEASILWTALRAITELLAAAGLDEGAATLLGAIQSTRDGHAVFGEDQIRLERVTATVRARLGGRFESAAAAGRDLDANDAAQLALRCWRDAGLTG
jgi:predicted ATPase/DNA-binding SARP family transcriptional activator